MPAGWSPRILALVLVALLAVAAAPPVAGGPVAHAPCADATDAVPFASNPSDFENLHFHEGALYVTGGDGKLHMLDPAGNDVVVADLGERSGAMVTGADGALYVRVGSGEVWRFDEPATGVHTVIATGLDGANGMTVDADGTLFVSDEPAGNVYRLPPEDPAAWDVWTVLDGPNGLAADVDAREMYVAMTVDGRSTILGVDLDDPTRVRDVAHLSFGAFSANVFWPLAPDRAGLPVTPYAPSDPANPVVFKALDDLTLGPDGKLYAAAWMTGEILRVDPATGAACAVATGLAQPSSVRVASGFGPHDGHLFVTDFGAHSELLVDSPVLGGSVSVVPLGLGR